MKLELFESTQMWSTEFNSPSLELNEKRQVTNSELKQDAFGFGIKTGFERNLSEKNMNEIVKRVNKMISGNDTKLEISIFEPTRELQIKIKDNKTGEVIREIPSEKMLQLGAYMRKLAGIIVDEKV